MQTCFLRLGIEEISIWQQDLWELLTDLVGLAPCGYQQWTLTGFYPSASEVPHSGSCLRALTVRQGVKNEENQKRKKK